MKNGFLGAIYDGLEATVDTLAEAVRGYPSSEAALRADAREDRSLIRAGHDPSDVAERRERLDAEMWEAVWSDLCFSSLREPGGWRRGDLESLLERYDDLDVRDLYHDGARPEDFGYESIPDYDVVAGRGALSLPPECSSGTLSLAPEDPHGACSLTEPDSHSGRA